VKSWAGYAQGTLAVGEASNVTAGIRYTSDEREFSGTDTFAAPTNCPGTGPGTDNPLVVAQVCPSTAPPKVTQEEPTWRLSFDHRFSDELLMFASHNRGFKSGLYNMVNLRSGGRVRESSTPRGGIQVRPCGRQVRLNGAVFYNYDDLQIRHQRRPHRLSNAAKAEVMGAEIELQAAPTDNLRLYVGLAYLDTEFTEFPNAQLSTPREAFPFGNDVVTGSAEGNELDRAPDFNGSLAINYDIPTSNGTWGINGSYVYTGSFFWEPDNRRDEEGYGPERAGRLEEPSEAVHIYLFGRNLTDEEYSQFVSDGGLGDSSTYAAPLTYGLGVDLSFGGK
jgi:iron complex outermembrane receptor protein